ncbi:MAG: glucose 1-dehydrogenase [Chthoniobacterales bacterium]
MATSYQLAGRNVLVTGSSQGIGQSIAMRLAREGANVVINYHSHPETAEQTAADIRALGRKSVALVADLGNVADVQKLVADSIAALGSLDILVNNAGIEKNAPFTEVTEADYDLVLDTNLKGTFFTSQAFARHLIDRQSPGKIINISSVHEDLPFPHFTAYCASKGGMKMMMRNLSIELAPHGITVNNIAPGAIETPINAKLLHDPALLKSLLGNIPLARLGKTDDVAALAAFLASSDADYINGATLVVDGGLTWNYSEQ